MVSVIMLSTMEVPSRDSEGRSNSMPTWTAVPRVDFTFVTLPLSWILIESPTVGTSTEMHLPKQLGRR